MSEPKSRDHVEPSMKVNIYGLANIIYKLQKMHGDEKLIAALQEKRAVAIIEHSVFVALNELIDELLQINSFRVDCNPWTEPDCPDWQWS